MSTVKLVAGLLFLAAVLALLAQSCHMEPVPLPADPHEARIAILRARVAELEMQTAKRDTVWLRAKARVDTLRDSVLLHLTDTLVIREYVTRTDSALQACTELASDCRAFRREATALIDSQRVQVDWWRGEYAKQDAKAKRWRRLTWIAGGAGLVAGAWIRGR